MDVRFGIWNVTSLCRTDSLNTVARELAKCNLDLVAMQEVDGMTMTHLSVEMGTLTVT
jgi:endonuclease/exonuclease/phosphatase family metal-dependent hydrolase